MPPEIHPRRQVIAQRQIEQFRLLLKAVVPANPFYTAKFEAAEAPQKVSLLGDLYERFPFTTKQELAADQLANLPYGTNLTFALTRYTRCHQTSGTTSTPLRWLDTPESWEWMLRNWEFILRTSGAAPGDVAFFAFSFGPFIGFWLAFESALRVGLRCLPGGGMSSLARLKAIFDNGATVLCCTPTYALHLAEVATHNGMDLKSSPVKILIVAGEPGGSVPATRARLEEQWTGARIVDHHGMTEIGPVTFECPARPRVLHVIESAYIPEIIDPATGRHVEAGETGELVLTTLGRVGSPLIRYRTGDLVRSSVDGICECGRSDLALEGGILGRTDDMLVIRGVNVYPSAVEDVLHSQPWVGEFRVTVTQNASLPELSVAVEPKPGTVEAESLRRTLETALQSTLNLRVPVEIVAEGSLPRFELKARRWVRNPERSDATVAGGER